MNRLIVSGLAALGLLSACYEQTPTSGPAAAPSTEDAAPATPSQPAPPAPVPASTPDTSQNAKPKRAVIDWDAARADFARTAAQRGDDDAFAIAGGGTAPPVPVLLPSMPFTTASTDESAPKLQFRPLADGYFAIYPGEAYDMIINGTDRLVSAPDRADTAPVTDLRFEYTLTGAQIAFSRYGASYLVEFACKGAAAELGQTCISEAEARAAAEDLLLGGTR